MIFNYLFNSVKTFNFCALIPHWSRCSLFKFVISINYNFFAIDWILKFIRIGLFFRRVFLGFGSIYRCKKVDEIAQLSLVLNERIKRMSTLEGSYWRVSVLFDECCQISSCATRVVINLEPVLVYHSRYVRGRLEKQECRVLVHLKAGETLLGIAQLRAVDPSKIIVLKKSIRMLLLN